MLRTRIITTLGALTLAGLMSGSASAQYYYDGGQGVVISMPDLFGVFSRPAPRPPRSVPQVIDVERHLRQERRSARVRTVIDRDELGGVAELWADGAPTRPDATRCAPHCPTSVMDDPTLRPGDMVMTDAGLMVFRGGRAPHQARDFRPAAESRLNARDRKFVEAIERTPGQNQRALADIRDGRNVKVAEAASSARQQ